MKLIKQNKFWYYIKGFSHLLFPKRKNFSSKIDELKKELTPIQYQKNCERIDYYCKIENAKSQLSNLISIKDLKNVKTPKSYYFDLYEYARFFDENQKIDFVFGDVIHVPPVPSIVKSRPISDDNQNSVLINMDKARHFVWIQNDIDFLKKENRMIGRCSIYQKHRFDFFNQYFHNPICDLGQVNKNGGKKEWIKPKLSLKEHLKYKFILSLQGNDVATNLKWIMSSNSIAIMPRPTIETWFMEGKLQGGVHYIEIKEDYSDLEEKLAFYIDNPQKCLEIIKNAHQHCEQFFNPKVEDLCSLMVLEKYFFE